MPLPGAVAAIERDMRGLFGSRLQSLVAYGLRAAADRGGIDRSSATDASHHEGKPLTHTLAVIDTLSSEDLRACTARIDEWHDLGLATPLLLATHEFGRSLDVFPYEFGAILADYTVVCGPNPFNGLAVDAAHLRHACEVEARGHLLHLREGYLETRGRGDALSLLILESVPAFATLLTNVARLDGAEIADVASAARHIERRLELPSATPSAIVALAGAAEISSAEGERLFPPYLAAVERLVQHVDAWG